MTEEKCNKWNEVIREITSDKSVEEEWDFF